MSGSINVVVGDELEMLDTDEGEVGQNTHPAWGFREDHDAEKGSHGKQALQSQGEPELNRRVAHKRHAVVDPVGRHDAEDVDGQLDGQLKVEISARVFVLESFDLPPCRGHQPA